MIEIEKLDPLYWVQRAADVRGQAKKMKDPVAKHYMDRFAEEYDRLARTEQQMLVRRNVASARRQEDLLPPKSEGEEPQGVGSEEKAAAPAAEPVKIPQAVLDQFLSP